MFWLITKRRPFQFALAAAVALALSVCCQSSLADETVQACGSYANNVFGASSIPAIAATAGCPTPGNPQSGIALTNDASATAGQAGRWQAVAPAGLELVGATASGVNSLGVNDGRGYGGGFYWAGGGTQTNDASPGDVGMVFSSPSSYFGMQLICGKSTCGINLESAARLDVGAFSLYVRETVGPSFVAPTGLWAASGWVRGTWPFFAWGSRSLSTRSVRSLTAANGLLL